MNELPSPNSTGSFSPSLCEPAATCMPPFSAPTSSSAIQQVTAPWRGERPVGVVLVPGELSADDRLLDHDAVLHQDDLLRPEQLARHARDHRVGVDLPEALVALPEVEQERHRMRLLLDLGLLHDGRRRAGADGRLVLAAIDDRVGQLVGLRFAPTLEVVVERLAEPPRPARRRGRESGTGSPARGRSRSPRESMVRYGRRSLRSSSS